MNDQDLQAKFKNVSCTVDIAISHEISMPLPLAAKLFTNASCSVKLDDYSFFNLFPHNWGLGNDVYQDLMEFFAYQDEVNYAYAELDRTTLKLVQLGNVEKFKLPLLDMGI